MVKTTQQTLPLRYQQNIFDSGNMVLIKRGGCSFMEKSYNAQDNGAVGAIIYNNDENDIDSNIDMVNDESGRQIDIPVLWLVGRNGHMMVDSMLDVSIQS